MTASELAAKLNGREYGNEITAQEEKDAKADGLVVMFGASDDLVELRGAIHDETGCYGSATIALTGTGLLENPCDNEECPYFHKLRDAAVKVKAWWGRDGYSWVYEVPFAHATFEVMDGDKKYCRGVVFSLADVRAMEGKK